MRADEATRVRQSASAKTHPDILRSLAHDPSVTVRASLAMNPALPPQVSAILAKDSDARVRSILSRRIANLMPGLSAPDQQRVQQDAIATLTALVAEAGLRVRTSIAETVRDMPDGPREIIMRLAHDPEVMVSEPVILFSPMLSPEDLVALIASGPPASTVHSIARRPELNASVSDAVVGCADSTAIRALLANRTAQIREATLDALAAQSEENPDWHEPLVHRPHLPPRAARILSEIVSTHLLEVLAARDDIDPKLGEELRAVLDQSGSYRSHGTAPTEPAYTEMTAPAALATANAANAAGRLDDGAILNALRSNAIVLATAMLAVKADVPMPVIERACGLRSAKAIVSLAWKAGFTAQTAVLLQTALGRISPEAVLRPAQGTYYPMPVEEMRWQLGFLGVGDRGLRAWTPRRLGA